MGSSLEASPASRERQISTSRAALSQADDTEPIVAELFSVERLEQHGESLAAAQGVTREPRTGHPIRQRVAENGRVLLHAYRVLAQAIKDERSITPAAEWLVDNFHVVEEQLREIRDDLPVDYYRELPKLADGHLEGYPRVLGLGWAYIAHSDSRFDPESLRRLVVAYQRVEPLTLGELWAIAISLRILLVENLRRLAEQIVRSRAARQEADELADSLLGLGSETPERAAATLRRLTRLSLPTSGKVQLFQRLRDQDPAVTPALPWPEGVLAAEGTAAEETVRLEHQRQAAMNVTVRNVITSMRLISWFDWAQFVESVSLVDEALRAGSAFGAMDFATRDRYRHAIEELARSSGRTEVEVARTAVTTAGDSSATAAADVAPTGRPSPETAPSPTRRDPGWFLISDGRPALERVLHVRLPTAARLRRGYLRAATPAYLSGAASPPHAIRAMAAVEEYLLRREDGLVLLFTPPFAVSDVDPGYIRGYLPGVRENGGQYTHGAIWSVLAFATLGDGDKAGELFSILNPINHASTRAGVHRHKVEPYVMAADVYSEPPHVGRDGWTWYTGSAGWMYQAGIESILGFRLRGATLLIEPCIPRAWPRYEIDFAYHGSRYEIAVENPHGVSRGVLSAELDGEPLAGPGAAVPLVDDGQTHRVKVTLG